MAWPFPVSALEHGAFVFGGLLVYVVVARLGHERRYPSSAIAWVMLIAFLPYAGIPLFLLFGNRKFARPGRKAGAAGVYARDTAGVPVWATQVLAAVEVPAPAANAKVAFQADGRESMQALLDLIREARRGIGLCTFILSRDETGIAIVDALARRAREGVRVRVLLDAIGCLGTSRGQIGALRAAGAAVRWFMPILHNPLHGRLNLRYHRKLVVADGERMWSGGRNLAAEYFVGEAGNAAWDDLSFVVDGALAGHAQELFDADWAYASGGARDSTSHADRATAASAGAWAQLVPSGPDQADDTVYALLLAGAHRARDRLLLATPYFVPDDPLQYALCMAARRGVRVALVVPGRSNHRLADLARERPLRELVKAGAEVHLAASMMHGKAMVIDREIALCGSVNLDCRSLFLNYELMTVFYSPDEIAWLAAWIGERIAQSKRHAGDPPTLLQDVLEGAVRSVGFQL